MLHDYGNKLPKNRDLFRAYLWWCPYSHYSKFQITVCPKLASCKFSHVQYKSMNLVSLNNIIQDLFHHSAMNILLFPPYPPLVTLIEVQLQVTLVEIC